DPADVTGIVGDGSAINLAEASGSDTATDTATVGNAASYTKNAPAGSFPRKLGGDQIVTGGTQSYTFSDSTNAVTVTIPPAALPTGRHLSVYAADGSYWASHVGSGRKFLDGYAVAFTASGASTPASPSASITVRASDPRASRKRDKLYAVNATGLGTSTGSVK